VVRVIGRIFLAFGILFFMSCKKKEKPLIHYLVNAKVTLQPDFGIPHINARVEIYFSTLEVSGALRGANVLINGDTLLELIDTPGVYKISWVEVIPSFDTFNLRVNDELSITVSKPYPENNNIVYPPAWPPETLNLYDSITVVWHPRENTNFYRVKVCKDTCIYEVNTLDTTHFIPGYIFNQSGGYLLKVSSINGPILYDSTIVENIDDNDFRGIFEVALEYFTYIWVSP